MISLYRLGAAVVRGRPGAVPSWASRARWDYASGGASLLPDGAAAPDGTARIGLARGLAFAGWDGGSGDDVRLRSLLGSEALALLDKGDRRSRRFGCGHGVRAGASRFWSAPEACAGAVGVVVRVRMVCCAAAPRSTDTSWTGRPAVRRQTEGA